MNKINLLSISANPVRKTFHTKQNEEQQKSTENLQNDLERMSAIAKSQINFRGKVKLTKSDAAFIASLGAAFGLSEAILDKITNTVANFLKSSDCIMLSDLAGAKNLDKQVYLTDKIFDITEMNPKDENAEKFVQKLFNRYEGINSEETEKTEETEESDNSFAEIENAVKSAITKILEADEKMIKAICKAFKFDSAKETSFRNLLKQLMKEENINSFKELDNAESMNTTAYMIDRISEEFGLSETENFALSNEFMRRITLHSLSYKPDITSLDLDMETYSRDNKILSKTLQKYNINQKDYDKLRIAMKHDAVNNNYKSIMDIFTQGNNIEQFVETSEALDSIMTPDEKLDFIIDMFSQNKKLTEIEKEIKENEQRQSNNFLKYCTAICLLDDEFNFSKDEMKQLKNYLKKQNYDFSQNNDIWKFIYEFYENMSNTKIDTDKMFKIISRINELSQDELQSYNFKYCQKLINKR